MRVAASVILSVFMFLQGSASLWITANFIANRESIAKNECRLREIPKNDCQGQCVLMKKLAKAEENKKQQAELEIKPVQLFYTPVKILSPQFLTNTPLALSENSEYQPFFIVSEHFSSIFRPPIA